MLLLLRRWLIVATDNLNLVCSDWNPWCRSGRCHRSLCCYCHPYHHQCCSSTFPSPCLHGVTAVGAAQQDQSKLCLAESSFWCARHLTPRLLCSIPLLLLRCLDNAVRPFAACTSLLRQPPVNCGLPFVLSVQSDCLNHQCYCLLSGDSCCRHCHTRAKMLLPPLTMCTACVQTTRVTVVLQYYLDAMPYLVYSPSDYWSPRG